MDISIANKMNMKIKTSRFWDALYVICLAIIAFTGLKSPVINTIFVFLFMYLLLSGNQTNIIFLYAILRSFFGYSNIQLTLLGGIVLANSTWCNIVVLLITAKFLLFYGKTQISNKKIPFYILLVYCAFISCITATTLVGIGLLCSMFVVSKILSLLKQGNEEKLNRYIGFVLLCVIAEIIYGVLYNAVSDGYAWRALQFSGVRDPNNMALSCNYVFALLAIANNRIKNRKILIIVKIFLAVVVVSTLSFSGICTMIAIFSTSALVGEKKSSTKKVLLGLFICSMLVIAMHNYETLIYSLQNSEVSTLRGLGERLSIMLDKYESGDYDAVTSGRTGLWVEWINHIRNGAFTERLFGSTHWFDKITEAVGRTAHNAYIDILVKYGILGMILFAINVIKSFICRINSRQYTSLFMSVIMLVNMFARSMSLESVFIYGFLLVI